MTRIDSGAGRDDLLRGALSRIASGGGDASALRELFEERTAQLRKSFEDSSAQAGASWNPAGG